MKVGADGELNFINLVNNKINIIKKNENENVCILICLHELKECLFLDTTHPEPHLAHAGQFSNDIVHMHHKDSAVIAH